MTVSQKRACLKGQLSGQKHPGMAHVEHYLVDHIRYSCFCYCHYTVIGARQSVYQPASANALTAGDYSEFILSVTLRRLLA